MWKLGPIRVLLMLKDTFFEVLTAYPDNHKYSLSVNFPALIIVKDFRYWLKSG